MQPETESAARCRKILFLCRFSGYSGGMEETRETPSTFAAREIRMMQQGTEYNDLPGTHITPNRLVAYNLAYWRKVAGLTQAELAERLNRNDPSKPWTNASVSAAERSWDGKRVRQFDADLLFSLATIFGIPMLAFFLPPEDDGVKQRYLIDMPHPHGLNECMTMWDVLDWASNTAGFDWNPDAEDEAPVVARVRETNNRYRDRLDSTLTYYRREILDGGAEPQYADEAWGADEDDERADIVAKLARARQHYESLRQLMGDISAVQEDLHYKLGLISQSERLKPKVARDVVKRFRAGEQIKDIAKSIRKPRWMVEKALIDAREGRLVYSAEERAYVFKSTKEEDALFEQRLAEAAAQAGGVWQGIPPRPVPLDPQTEAAIKRAERVEQQQEDGGI